MITGTVLGFITHVFSISISRSLYFVRFSIVFNKVILSVRIDDRHIDRQTGSFLLVFHHYVLSVYFYLFLSLDCPRSIVVVWFSATVAVRLML